MLDLPCHVLMEIALYDRFSILVSIIFDIFKTAFHHYKIN